MNVTEITVPLEEALGRCRCKLDSASSLPALRESIRSPKKKRPFPIVSVRLPANAGVTGTWSYELVQMAGPIEQLRNEPSLVTRNLAYI